MIERVPSICWSTSLPFREYWLDTYSISKWHTLLKLIYILIKLALEGLKYTSSTFLSQEIPVYLEYFAKVHVANQQI